MAVDPQEVGAQSEQPSVERTEQPSSPPERESESGFMNNLFRRVLGGVFGGDDEEPSGRGEPESAPEPEATPEPAPEPTISREERYRRDVQSGIDRAMAQRAWDDAIAASDAGDHDRLFKLAEGGNKRALQELSDRGLTYERGAAQAKADAVARQQEAQNQVFSHFATAWDEAVVKPLMDLLPAQTQARFKADEAYAGIDGRRALTLAALTEIRKAARAEGVAQALQDPGKAKQLLAPGSPLLEAILRNPTVNKQVRAAMRPDLPEPDLIPSLGHARGGERENDVMNDIFRRALGASLDRADEERPAMAGGRNGRVTNRDLLDDDE